MSVYKFIASGIRNKTDGGDRISSMSTRIGLVSVAVSIFVIIVALCVVRGFRSEIRFKTSGYMGDLALVTPGQTPLNDIYPFSDRSCSAAISKASTASTISVSSPLVWTTESCRTTAERGLPMKS